MSLFYSVIFHSKSTSTHHKIALDALRHLNNPHAEQWLNLFLKYNDRYLNGAKDPDKKFHDFKNHVLHTSEGFWGGAPKAADIWYDILVRALKKKDWNEAVYAAGVLSHYYCDPIQPLHTGQEEAEGKIHKIFEWAVAKSYEDLQERLETKFGGYPIVHVPSGNNWLELMIREGATYSHPYYDLILDHYDFERGVKNPKDGLDETLNDALAQLIGYAVVGFARVLDRAFEEANVTPPTVKNGLRGFLASLQIPIYWVLRKLEDKEEKKQVMAIYEEVKEKGKAIESLPPDDKEVRKLHAQEVLKKPIEELDKLPPRETGTKHGHYEPLPHSASKHDASSQNGPEKQVTPQQEPKQTSITAPKEHDSHDTPTPREPISHEKPASAARKERALRWYLELTDDVVDAPSIGKKTASYLHAQGIKTIKDLLSADPESLAEKLNNRRITSEIIRIWQDQARLAYQIPFIRGHDVKILVNSGITTAQALASFTPETLLDKISAFVNSKEGERALRGSSKPDLDEVTDWIEWAKHARS